MSLSVVVTITIGDRKYEAGTTDIDVVTEEGHTSSTGSFSSYNGGAMLGLMDAAINQARDKVVSKLEAIKGKDEFNA